MSLSIDDAQIYLEVPSEQKRLIPQQPGIAHQELLVHLVDDAVVGTPQPLDWEVSGAVEGNGESRTVPPVSLNGDVTMHNFDSMIAEPGDVQNSDRRSPSRRSVRIKGEKME